VQCTLSVVEPTRENDAELESGGMMELITGLLLYQPLPPNMQAAFLQENNGHTSLLIDVGFGAAPATASNLFFGRQKHSGATITVFGTRAFSPATGAQITYSQVQ
jgi:hypothetical protein